MNCKRRHLFVYPTKTELENTTKNTCVDVSMKNMFKKMSIAKEKMIRSVMTQQEISAFIRSQEYLTLRWFEYMYID